MHRLAMYSPLRTWKKGEIPEPSFVSISVGTHSGSDGEILLSAELMTDAEIDYAVDQLQGELEEFRKEAKKELRTLKAKMRQKWLNLRFEAEAPNSGTPLKGIR